MRLLCTGDLHLGAGSDYGREPGERLREQRLVWQTICLEAVKSEVDAVLFAGDAWERRRPTVPELLAFKEGVDILFDNDIQVVVIPGNHDLEAFDRPAAYELFPDSDSLFVYMTGPTTVRTFSTRGKEATVAGLPWTPVANLVARNGGGDRDELHARAAELLLDTARDLRAQCPDEGPKILLLHWSVSGASLPTGLPTDTLREPVIPLDELERLGFDAIVCGHIHSGGVFGWADFQALRCPVFYVGSPMPLNFGEASIDHGVWILDTERWRPEFVPIESRPFVTIDSLVFEPLEPITINCPVDGAIVKVRYKATADQARRIDHAAIRQALLDAGAHKVFSIEPSIEREQRARVEGLDEDLTPSDALHAYAFANDIDDDTERAMQQRTGRYLEAVGS